MAREGVGGWFGLGLGAEPFRGHARVSSLTESPPHPLDRRRTAEGEGYCAAFNPMWVPMVSNRSPTSFNAPDGPDAPEPATYFSDVPRGDLTFPAISRVAPYTQLWSSTYRLSSLESFQRVPRSSSSLKNPKTPCKLGLLLAR